MMIKKHVKPNPQRNIKGGIAEQEASVHISNVMLVDSEGESAPSVGFKHRRRRRRSASPSPTTGAEIPRIEELKRSRAPSRSYQLSAFNCSLQVTERTVQRYTKQRIKLMANELNSLHPKPHATVRRNPSP